MLSLSPEMTVEALARALETMAFISPMPPEPPLALPPRCRVVGIGFRGTACGQIELAASEDFGALLAANVLGCEATAPEAAERAADALKELLNVFAGDLLEQFSRRDAARFEMSVPRIGPLEDFEDWNTLLQASPEQACDAEGHLLAARIQVDQ